MTEYNLGQLDTVAGVLTFTLRHGDPSLEVPSRIRIISIGKILERLDFTVGVNEIQNLETPIQEEYSTYSEGFWNKAINETIYEEDVQLKVTIEQGLGPKLIFWGIISRESSTFNEHYLSGSSHLRSGTLVWVSLIYRLKETKTTELVTDVLSRDVSGTYNGNPYFFIKVKDIIASMISLTFGQSFSTNDVVIRNDLDIRYRKDAGGTSYHGFVDVWVITNLGSFLSTSTKYWPDRFANCFDCLQYLLKNFGFVARWFYEDDRHKLELLTRGRSYSTLLTFGEREKESRVTAIHAVKPFNIRCKFFQVDAYTDQHWYVDGALGGGFRPYDDEDPEKFEPPKFSDIHLDVEMDWILSWDSEQGVTEHLYINPTGTTYERVTAIQFYDYSAQSMAELEKGTEALATYYFKRFNPNRRKFNRTYGKLLATESDVDSIEHLRLLKRTQFNDGLGSRTYYASELAMDFEENEVTIDWVEE